MLEIIEREDIHEVTLKPLWDMLKHAPTEVTETMKKKDLDLGDDFFLFKMDNTQRQWLRENPGIIFLDATVFHTMKF